MSEIKDMANDAAAELKEALGDAASNVVFFEEIEGRYREVLALLKEDVFALEQYREMTGLDLPCVEMTKDAIYILEDTLNRLSINKTDFMDLSSETESEEPVGEEGVA